MALVRPILYIVGAIVALAIVFFVGRAAWNAVFVSAPEAVTTADAPAPAAPVQAPTSAPPATPSADKRLDEFLKSAEARMKAAEEAANARVKAAEEALAKAKVSPTAAPVAAAAPTAPAPPNQSSSSGVPSITGNYTTNPIVIEGPRFFTCQKSTTVDASQGSQYWQSGKTAGCAASVKNLPSGWVVLVQGYFVDLDGKRFNGAILARDKDVDTTFYDGALWVGPQEEGKGRFVNYIQEAKIRGWLLTEAQPLNSWK